MQDIFWVDAIGLDWIEPGALPAFALYTA